MKAVLVVDDNDDVRGYVSSILGAVCRSVGIGEPDVYFGLTRCIGYGCK